MDKKGFIRSGWVIPAIVFAAACATEASSADEDWAPPIVTPDGKNDGVLDLAPPLVFDAVETGYVRGASYDVYKVDLRAGDRVALSMGALEGGFRPGPSLYFAGTTAVASTSTRSNRTDVVKEFLALNSGRYYAVARAYRNEGEGNYAIELRCLSGPCAGGPALMPGRTLLPEERSTCLRNARRCAFEKLPSFDGAVGPARARTAFTTCLVDAPALADGASCASACDPLTDGPEAQRNAPGQTCESLIAALPYYADFDLACHRRLEGCMDECYAAGPEGPFESFATSPERVCWSTGALGRCDDYARTLVECGGTRNADDVAACHDWCEATTGAWDDDIDNYCEEVCGALE